MVEWEEENKTKLPQILRSQNTVTVDCQGYRTDKGGGGRAAQILTDDGGNDHLSKQITKTITVMQLSNDKGDFEKLEARIFS